MNSMFVRLGNAWWRSSSGPMLSTYESSTASTNSEQCGLLVEHVVMENVCLPVFKGYATTRWTGESGRKGILGGASLGSPISASYSFLIRLSVYRPDTVSSRI